MPKKVMVVIAKEGYQDKELDDVRSELVKAGFEPVLASTERGPCTGKFGGKEEAKVSLGDADIRDYDRIVFIGGPGAEGLSKNADALRIARETVEQKKPLGAVCIAPLILAEAGVLRGKRATVWDSGGEQVAILEQNGAEYSGDKVTADGLIVTGNGPAAAVDFGKMFAAM